LARKRHGEEREILLALARAEERHAAHWSERLHPAEQAPGRVGARARLLSWLARRLGSLLVLSLVQRAEAGGHYDTEPDATAAMAADERVHALVVAGLAQRHRARAAGWFRAAVFGANDGLVSNFSLVLGVAGAGSSSQVILLAGLAGLLAGALSMAAGEYVSVRSQRELLDAAAHELDPATLRALHDHEAVSSHWSSGPRASLPTRPSSAPRLCSAMTAPSFPARQRWPTRTWSGPRRRRPGRASQPSPAAPPSRSCPSW